MPEEEKMPMVEKPEEDVPSTKENVPPVEEKVEKAPVGAEMDAGITEVIDRIQDTVAKLADLVGELVQMQANDNDIVGEIQESLKGVVREEVNKSLDGFKEEIIKEITEAIKIGIPEPKGYLKPTEPKPPEGEEKESVAVKEEDIDKLEPLKPVGGKGARVEKGDTMDDVQKRLELVEKIMKGEITNVIAAKKMLNEF